MQVGLYDLRLKVGVTCHCVVSLDKKLYVKGMKDLDPIETVVPRWWGIDTRKFGIKPVK